MIVRRARELLVASTTLSIAAAAHLAAGGVLPSSALGWVVPVALTLPVAVWTARRRLTLRRLLPAMAALQVVQHTTLSFMATADAVRGGTSPVPAGGHGAHAGHLALDAGALASPTLTAGGHAHDAGTATSALMLGAHAAAVVLTALLVAAGDRAAAFLVVWLGAVALLVAAPWPPLPARRNLPPRTTSWVPRTWWALAGLRLRGPPGAPAHA